MDHRTRLAVLAALMATACGQAEKPVGADSTQDAAVTDGGGGLTDDAGLDAAAGEETKADAAGPAACQTTVDCKGEGERCIDGTCQPPIACQSDKQCVAADMVCDDGSGLCVQCLAAEDCPEGTACKANQCLPPPTPCVSSKECGANQVCDKAISGCVECAAAEDCPSAFRCVEGVCLPQACAPNKAECQAGKLAICKADGGSWTSTDCPSGQVCSGGGCHTPTCTPGTKVCQGAEVHSCGADGVATTLAEDCGSTGKLCAAGACVTATCTAGAKQCIDAAKLGTCKADASGWDITACADGQGCVDGACVNLVCKPSAVGCVGDVISTCNAQGTKLDPGEDCGTAGKVCLGGACVAKGCSGGVAQCKDEATLATCKADGSGWAEAKCGDGKVCVDGACAAKVCTEGKSTCIGDVIATCEASGTSLKPGQDCGSAGKTCKDGACVEKAATGWQVHGGFVTVPDSDGGIWRVIDQGFIHQQSCGGGYCVVGGIAP